MKRNLGGERDLDHIIHAAMRGMDRACLEYGVPGRPHLLPGPRVRRAPERDHRREGHQVPQPRRGRASTWPAPRPTPSSCKRRGRALPRHVRAGPRRRARHHRPHRRDRRHRRRRGGARWSRSCKPRPHRPRRLRGQRRARDGAPAASAARCSRLCPSSNLRTHAVERWDEMKDVVQTLLGQQGPAHPQHRRALHARHRHAPRARAGHRARGHDRGPGRARALDRPRGDVFAELDGGPAARRDCARCPTFAARRCTPPTSRPAPSWSPSPAWRCRSSTPASSTSTARCASGPGSSTSPTWARSCVRGRGRAGQPCRSW